MPPTRKKARSTAAAPRIPDRRTELAGAVSRPGTTRAAAPDSAIGVRLEVLAWLAVAFVVFATRLLNLDGAPLQPSEGALAMTSWDLLHRAGISLGTSPLLVDANVLMFMLFGSSDAVARAAVAGSGAFLAMSPFFLRRHLGRIGALFSAAVLAVSPTLILGSRTLDPAIPTLALGAGIVIAGQAYAASHRSWYLAGIGIALALLLMSGPLAYDVLIVFGGFAVVYLYERAKPGSPYPVDAVGFSSAATRLRSGNDQAAPAGLTPADWRAALTAFGLAGVLAWTGVLTNFEGLGGALAIPLGLWARSFSGSTLASAATFPVIFLGYEPLALGAGIMGMIVAGRPRRVLTTFFLWWTVVGLALLLVSNGREPLWAGLVVVPLALLAAGAAEWLARALESAEERRRLATFAPLALSLVATLMIAAGNASTPDPSVPRFVAIGPPLALLAFVVFIAVFYDVRSALVSASAVAGFCLVVFSVHAATLLSPGGALAPDLVFHPRVTSSDARTMVADVSLILDELHIARVVEGRPVTEDVQVAEPFADPLRWYLRHASNLKVVPVVAGSPAIAVVAANGRAPSEGYAGQVFQFSRSAQPPSLDPAALWRWFIYRQPGSTRTTSVKVYVKTQLAGH